MATHSEPGAASLAAGRAILQPRPHGRARQAQQQGHLLRRQHLFYRPLFRVRTLPKRTETDPARLAAPGCSRLARRSWPAHRVARHDPSSTTSSPCCPSSRAVCARSDCPWPRLARLTARDARRSLAQIAWSRSLAHSSNFRGSGTDLLTRLTASAPAQASSGGICPRRFRAAPRPCARPRPGDLGPVLGRDDDDLVWTAERSHGVMSGASARSSMFINFSVLAVDTAVTAVS
eukprot:COSAG06_NODE_8109_length_2267_cov_38.051565_1_plen_233_part_00